MRHIENPWVLGPNPFDDEGPDIICETLEEVNIYIDCDYTEDNIELIILGNDEWHTEYEEHDATSDVKHIYDKDLIKYRKQHNIIDTDTIAEMGIEKCEILAKEIFENWFAGVDM
jgi:hypothetical protein